MFDEIKDFVKSKIVNSKKFVAGANLVALMAFASPAGLCAEEQITATNPADYFAMCVERDIKPNAQLYKFNKSRQYRQKLTETNYDLWLKLYRQENAVYDKCKEETLEFSERSRKAKFGEVDIEKRGYMCDDLGCDICVNIQCIANDGFGCTKKYEEVLRQNIPDEDELTLLDNFEKPKSYFVRSVQKTK